MDIDLASGTQLQTDFVLLCVGVRPESGLAVAAGARVWGMGRGAWGVG